MSSQLAVTNTRPSECPGRDAKGASLFAKLFALVAIELLLMGIALWSYIVLRASYPSNASQLEGFIWAIAAGIAAVAGTAFLVVVANARKRFDFVVAHKCLGVAIVFGSILMGFLLVTLANNLVESETVVDLRDKLKPRTNAAMPAAATAYVAGDAANGKKWFTMSCVTCHGPTGDGVLNAAPSLRSSEFLRSSDDAAIAALIRNGRALDNPANKTGKVMPAKGGNPFLDEAKISDLVAFVKSLTGNGTAASSTATTSPSTIDSAEIASVTSDPAGTKPEVVREWTFDDLADLPQLTGETAIATGSQAFVKATCNKCHMAATDTIPLGPTLDQIVRKYPIDQLVQHLIEPSKEFDAKFQAEIVMLVDGRQISGVVASETETELVLIADLRTPQQQVVVEKEDIDERRASAVSPMPTGLLNVLQKDEIAGLISYIETTGKELAVANAPQANRWVIPAAANTEFTNRFAINKTVHLKSHEDEVAEADAGSYRQAIIVLFVLSTTLLVFHFLWVAGAGTGIVLNRELNLSARQQLQLTQSVAWFWSLGIVWLGLWFFMFFVIG